MARSVWDPDGGFFRNENENLTGEIHVLTARGHCRDDETVVPTAAPWFKGALVTCPNAQCEAVFRHTANSSRGMCSRCRRNYYVLKDGTIVDDAGLDLVIDAMCET